MKKNIGKKVIVASVILAVLLFFSAAGLNTLATNTDTTTLLVELENSGQLQQLQDNGRVLVDYDNGWVLLQVPKAQLNAYRNAYNTRLDNERYEIRLWNSGHSFDWRNGLPDMPSSLMANENQGRMPYMVHFIGPRPSNLWEQELISAGVSIEADLGPYTVLARMDAQTRRTVDRMDFVAWTGTYHPAFKIQDGLLAREGSIQVQFVPWNDVSFMELESKLVDFGVTTGRSDGVGITGVVDVTSLPALASLQEVYAISAYSLPQTLDNIGNEIHQVQALWYTSWSGLPERITGHTQVLGMQDSGFDLGRTDAGHPDFFRGPEGNRVIRYVDRTGESDPDGDEAGVAHGTHVIGIAAGNGWCWRKHMGAPDPDVDTSYHLGEATGVAPEAGLSMDGTVTQGGGVATSHGYWDTQESDGARVFINSWGAGPGNYNTDAANIDDRQNPDSGSAMTHAYTNLIIMSAGNDGPELHTISGRPQAKNTFGVGASENYRPDWSGADNPGKVASFSSRGGPSFSNGRIKPDVVGVGTAQIAPFGIGEWDYYSRTGQGVPQPGWFQDVDEYDYRIPGPGSDGRADYQYMAGTSMSGPQVAGLAALVREYYMLIHPEDLRITGIPSNPLIRATLINGAGRMNPMYDYPGYDQGWGIPNLRTSLYPRAPQTNQFAEHQFSSTDTWDAETDGGMELYVQSSEVPLKATLTWIDSSGATLNRRMYMTATNLDTGETYRSGVGNYDSDGWMIEGSTNIDTVNNVQRIEIEEPSPGNWQIQVVCTTTVGTHNNMAVVVSADFGPQDEYAVDLTTDYPTTLSVVAGGQSNLPIRIRNWGTNADTISITDTSPGAIGIDISPSSSFSLASAEIAYANVIISAGAGASEGVHRFELIGTSSGDPSIQDTLVITVQVLEDKLPYRTTAADSEADEMWADVITFTDQGGVHRIFVTYLMDTAEGEAVFVRHSELDPSNGRPTGWSTPVQVDDGVVSYPGWPKLLHIRGGTHVDRVIVSWTGIHYASADVYYSRAYSSFADSTNYDNWDSPTLIDDNSGVSDFNNKRCVYMLWQDTGGSGLLTYVYEHLDSTYAGGIDGIGVGYATSGNGGDSWTNRGDIPGAESGGNLYYFFPHGVTDSNEVNWHFFYYRDAASNARMVVAKLQEGTSWTANINVMGDLSTDGYNWQFPKAAHVDLGGTNTIYVSAIYDHGGLIYDLSTGYIQGDYSVSNPPSHYSFGAQDGVAGNEIEQAGYMFSHVLGKTATEDGWAWTGYQEAGTAFDALNMDVARTDDFYNSLTMDRVTRDNYAKLNPQMASLTIGTTSYVYMTYHSSHGTVMEVDYQIFLNIFHTDWYIEADEEGPITSNVVASPSPIDKALQTTVDITATIDDTATGFSGINAAQYIITGTNIDSWDDVPWGGTFMTISGSSQIETASAEADISGLSVGSYHVWVRGRDEHNNWGTEYADYAVLHVEESVPVPPPPSITLTSPTGGESWQVGSSHDITWTTTPGDGTITNVVIEYSINGGASYTQLYNGADTGSHSWTIPNEPTTEARVRATVHDDNARSGSDTSGNFEIAEETFDPPTISLTRPTGGESWDAGTNEDITWTTTTGDGTITGIDLEYSTDAGASWTTIVTGTANTGSYSWLVPDVHTSEARIRATVHDDNAMSGVDTSGNFDIVGIPAAAPIDLDVQHTGAGEGDTTVETRYMRDDNVLGTTQSSTEQQSLIERTGGGALNNVVNWGIRVWAGGAEVTEGTPVAQVTRSANGEGIQSNTWNCPETGIADTDNVEVIVYANQEGGEWEQQASFVTEALGADQLDASTWTIYYYTRYETGQPGGNPTRFTRGWFHWGINTHDSRIADFSYSTIGGGGAGTEDNLVTWNASPDEPAKVTGYNIYRSASNEGPWDSTTLIATVPADGGPYEYVDSGAGTADETLWWYMVYSDQDGYEGDGVGPVQEPGEVLDTFDITLVAGGNADGWNFVSFNLELADTSLGTILADIEGSYDKVMYYDAAAGQWVSHVPGRAERFNNLDNWNHHMGLWIHATVGDTLTVEGSAPVSTDITLYPGWNMVGLPSDTIGNHGLPGQVSVVGYFSADAEYNMVYDYDPAAFEFAPGQGYMVYLDHTEPVVWTVDY